MLLCYGSCGLWLCFPKVHSQIKEKCDSLQLLVDQGNPAALEIKKYLEEYNAGQQALLAFIEELLLVNLFVISSFVYIKHVLFVTFLVCFVVCFLFVFLCCYFCQDDLAPCCAKAAILKNSDPEEELIIKKKELKALQDKALVHQHGATTMLKGIRKSHPSIF